MLDNYFTFFWSNFSSQFHQLNIKTNKQKTQIYGTKQKNKNKKIAIGNEWTKQKKMDVLNYLHLPSNEPPV
jgi:hypothetical protein